MIELHRVALLYCFNTLWQIPLLYMAAFLSGKLLRRSNVITQYRLWLSTFFLCLGFPLVGAIGWLRALLEHAFLHSRQVSQSVSDSIVAGADRIHPITHASHSLFGSLNAANILLAIWAVWILYRTLQIAWTYQRIARVVSVARSSERSVWLGDLLHKSNGKGVEVLVSEEVGMPATACIWGPVVLLPKIVARHSLRSDLDAVLAHESAHITRHDFICNLILEVLAIPIAYNPAIRCLLRQISQLRELICDRMAAEQTGGTTQYAQSLVRISEMLLQPIATTDPALGLFDGQELENRVMSLLDPTPRSPRMWTAVMSLLSFTIFVPCCLATAGVSFQPAALIAADLQPYAGTWHWMFRGKPFVTIELVAAGDHFTGYMTNGFFDFDADGNLADAGSHPGHSVIVRTFFSGKTLHIVVQDDQDKSLGEWTMNLIDSKTAEFNVADPNAPKNFRPLTAERASN
jgi:beta-lactamase regulating signal transducer with metallopeptidase domain